MALLDEYLSREELAAELKVSKRTLARWQDQADGLPVTRIGGRTLFRVDSVKAWLKAHERRPNSRRAV
jgi:excisionase family DNA binding protein